MVSTFSAAFAPFTLALGFVLVILALEWSAVRMGLSLHRPAAEPEIAPEIADLHAQFDLMPGSDPDLMTLLEASAALQNAASEASGASLPAIPLTIWCAALLLGFGLGGYLLQGLAAAFGLILRGFVAIPLATLIALAACRSLARYLARMVPVAEPAIPAIRYPGGLRGVVARGTARRDFPAEVQLQDHLGNLHILRAEPWNRDAEIPEGTEVITLREHLGPDRWGLRILPLP